MNLKVFDLPIAQIYRSVHWRFIAHSAVCCDAKDL